VTTSGFGDLIAPGGVLFDVHVANKRQLFGVLATHAARQTGLDSDQILNAMIEREQQGTTGFGAGTAIPHIRMPTVGRVVAIAAKLAMSINYAALDGLPVDLVVLMIAPSGNGADHLKALARISRALRDRDLTSKLRGCASADALQALLTQDLQSRAA